jgi:hypothetical protein
LLYEAGHKKEKKTTRIRNLFQEVFIESQRYKNRLPRNPPLVIVNPYAPSSSNISLLDGILIFSSWPPTDVDQIIRNPSHIHNNITICNTGASNIGGGNLTMNIGIFMTGTILMYVGKCYNAKECKRRHLLNGLVFVGPDGKRWVTYSQKEVLENIVLIAQ